MSRVISNLSENSVLVNIFMNDLENTDTTLTESGGHAKLGRTKKIFENKSGFKTDRVE